MIGFPPRSQTSVYLDDYKPNQFLTFTWMAMEQLGWNISKVEDNSITAITPFSVRSFHNRVVVNISDYEAEFSSTSMGMQVIDFFKNRKDLQLLTETIRNIAENTPQEQLEAEYAARLEKRKDDTPQTYISTGTDRLVDGFFAVFKPVPGYYVTPILITLNVLAYFLLGLTMVFDGHSFLNVSFKVLVQFGADFKLYTLTDQPWRLFTCTFMHAGILPLAFNMYILMVCGIYLERIIGSWRFLAAYLICGFASSTISLWWNDLIPSVGASGAIYGLIGVMLAILSRKNMVEPIEKKSLLISIFITVVLHNILALITGNPVDHGAHFGGLIFGFILTHCYYYAIFQDKRRWLKKWAFATASGVVIILAFAFFFSMKWGAEDYKDQVDRLVRNESMAAEASDYTLTGNGRTLYASNSIGNKIKNMGIYYFDQNLSLLAEMDSETFSPGAKRLNSALRDYYNLYKEYYVVQYQRVEAGSYAFNDKIDELWDKLEEEKKKLSLLGWKVH